jgi:hypothetical protein
MTHSTFSSTTKLVFGGARHRRIRILKGDNKRTNIRTALHSEYRIPEIIVQLLAATLRPNVSAAEGGLLYRCSRWDTCAGMVSVLGG